MFLLHLETILYAPEGGSAYRRQYLGGLSSISSHGKLCFQSFHFSEAPHVTLLIGEFGTEEGLYEIFSQFYADHSRAQHQNIDVVVLHSLMR